MPAYLMISALVLGQADVATESVGSIRIRNDANQPWNLWMYLGDKKEWSQPVPFLPKKSVVKVSLVSPGRYYLVLRDEAKRDAHYGWVDLPQISRNLPEDAVVSLTTVLEKKTREETYTVLVPKTQKVVVEEVVNGVLTRREVVQTVNVSEQRKRNVEVTEHTPKFDVHSEGAIVALSDFDYRPDVEIHPPLANAPVIGKRPISGGGRVPSDRSPYGASAYQGYNPERGFQLDHSQSFSVGGSHSFSDGYSRESRPTFSQPGSSGFSGFNQSQSPKRGSFNSPSYKPPTRFPGPVNPGSFKSTSPAFKSTSPARD